MFVFTEVAEHRMLRIGFAIEVAELRQLLSIEELEAEANGRWFISMLGVHRDWRGKGVGTVLLAVADAKRAETRANGLALIVEDANEGARRLYARKGYAVRSHRKMIKFAGSGANGDEWLLMVKE